MSSIAEFTPSVRNYISSIQANAEFSPFFASGLGEMPRPPGNEYGVSGGSSVSISVGQTSDQHSKMVRHYSPTPTSSDVIKIDYLSHRRFRELNDGDYLLFYHARKEGKSYANRKACNILIYQPTKAPPPEPTKVELIYRAMLKRGLIQLY